MKKTFRIVQFFSNIAIILIALLLGFIVLRQNLFLPTNTTGDSTSKNVGNQATTLSPVQVSTSKNISNITPVGKVVPLEEINWKQNKRTLVLYISTTCRYCNESSPFYQRLVKEALTKGITLVAVMPQSIDEAKEYLRSHDLNITQVYKTSIASIGVTATPTLLLVGPDGVVSDYWRGRLQPDKESEVLSKLVS